MLNIQHFFCNVCFSVILHFDYYAKPHMMINLIANNKVKR